MRMIYRGIRAYKAGGRFIVVQWRHERSEMTLHRIILDHIEMIPLEYL
jgi:hypothetical protein